MKKFMFSAIAMIAFVGSSMANTAEVEYNKVLVLEKSCEEKAMDYVDGINGLTVMQAYYAYTGYLDACNAGKKKSVSAN